MRRVLQVGQSTKSIRKDLDFSTHDTFQASANDRGGGVCTWCSSAFVSRTYIIGESLEQQRSNTHSNSTKTLTPTLEQQVHSMLEDVTYQMTKMSEEEIHQYLAGYVV